jgi:hypothetical protein
MSFPTDQVYALSVLDPVMAVESPAWVRTVISDLVVNSFRKSKGLPHKYSDFSTLYNTAHAYPWMDLVAHLGAILKPCAPDIEAALFKFLKPAQPSVNIPQEPRSDDVKPVLRLQKPAPQAPKVQGPTGAKKVLAIDGITFDSEERVTSLHDRMEGSRGPTGPSAPEIPTGVKLDIAKVPLSEQEFIRGLRSRFQK